MNEHTHGQARRILSRQRLNGACMREATYRTAAVQQDMDRTGLPTYVMTLIRGSLVVPSSTGMTSPFILCSFLDRVTGLQLRQPPV